MFWLILLVHLSSNSAAVDFTFQPVGVDSISTSHVPGSMPSTNPPPEIAGFVLKFETNIIG